VLIVEEGQEPEPFWDLIGKRDVVVKTDEE
jgi:hypothetical protein